MIIFLFFSAEESSYHHVFILRLRLLLLLSLLISTVTGVGSVLSFLQASVLTRSLTPEVSSCLLPVMFICVWSLYLLNN